MYKNFFGLTDFPFRFNPEPRFLYWTGVALEAWASLTYGIETRQGFLLLTGEVGTGKTTLLNALQDWLREHDVATAFLSHSQLSNAEELLDLVMAEFGIACDPRLRSHTLLKLKGWLLERHRAGKTSVLIVDEAQNLSEQLLEEIRLLTNLETASDKLLQIVLCGQPELNEKLNQPQLRQLLQRIVFRCRTGSLDQEETCRYISARLRIAGSLTSDVFSREAMEAIHRYSKGIPRVINLLCEHSLINSFAEQKKPIPVEVVEEISLEFMLDGTAPLVSLSPTSCPEFEPDPVQRQEDLRCNQFSYLSAEHESVANTFEETKL